MTKIRANIHADTLYPGDKDKLFADIDSYIHSLDSNEIAKKLGRHPSELTVKALIVPHSGYDYCGKLLGEAYSLLVNQKIDEAFMLGTSHFSQFDGYAISDFQKWETPLGVIEQSHRTTQIISSDNMKKHDIIVNNNDIHRGEHSIEVQLPFLRYLSHGGVRIIPGLVGKVSPRILATYLDNLVDRDDIIIGTAELSTGFPKDYAEVIDATAIDAITDLDTDRVLSEKFQSTGQNVIATIVELAKAHDWHSALLEYQNSAEIDNNQERTTGRATIVFYE